MLLTQSVDDPRTNGGGMELRVINIVMHTDYRIISLASGSSPRCLTTMLAKRYKNRIYEFTFTQS
nr:MAG TPA: hypothetical protein [Crassvirales sp.]